MMGKKSLKSQYLKENNKHKVKLSTLMCIWNSSMLKDIINANINV